MKISTWRSGLVNWLSTKITIDSWDLHEPLYPGITHAFLPPLRSFMLKVVGNNDIIAEAVQEIWLTTMYPRELKYQQLPLNTIEGAYSSLCQKILMEHTKIANIIDLDIGHTQHINQQPIQVIEYGDDQADWLIRLCIVAAIKWTPELEDDADNPDYPVLSITANVYRSYIPSDDFSDKVLDYTANILNEP
jgi:hypothetical protein